MPSSTKEQLVQLTLHVGRPIYGTCDQIEDRLSERTSALVIGQAGVGKSTVLRGMSCLLSGTVRRCVAVVDATSELGGFGVIPRRALVVRDVTRLQVKVRLQLFRSFRTRRRTILHILLSWTNSGIRARWRPQDQGAVLIVSVRNTCLSQLVHNPTLNPLIGGVKSVSITDMRMRETHSQSKPGSS